MSVPLLLSKVPPLIKGIRVAGGKPSMGSLEEAALELALDSRDLR